MPKHIKSVSRIDVPGNKIIEEFIGRVNSGHKEISIARMKSPAGWSEPPQSPEFDEYTLVLSGSLTVKTEDGEFIVNQNEAFIAEKGVTVQYSTPGTEGATYIAICLPAFHPDTVHRKE